VGALINVYQIELSSPLAFVKAQNSMNSCASYYVGIKANCSCVVQKMARDVDRPEHGGHVYKCQGVNVGKATVERACCLASAGSRYDIMAVTCEHSYGA
jgi:hypothetical protein